MGTMPTVENAVTHHLDVVDRQVASIVDTCTAEGSTVRDYNADGFELVTATRPYSENERREEHDRN